MKDVVYEFDVKRDIAFVFENIYKDGIYRLWSSAFAEDSHYEGDLVEGAKIRFLDVKGNGIGGKVGRITPNEYLEFLLGYEIRDNKEEYLDKEGVEAYYFSTNDDGSTHVKVTSSIPEEYFDMMNDMWKIAIESIIKTLENL